MQAELSARVITNSKRIRRQNESTEQREFRLAKMREYNYSNKAKRQNETADQRETRLEKMRKYNI